MKVLCKLDNFLELDDKLMIERIKKYINLSDGQLDLEKNREYNVYGVEFRDNAPWYYLCIDDEDDPVQFPADLFEVTDKRMSTYWRLSFASYISYKNTLETQSFLAFPEWAEDPTFFERFVDGDPSTIPIFQKYRKLMDEEFS